MVITKRTKTRDVLPLLTKEMVEELIEAVPAVKFSKKPIISLSIEEFNELLDEEAVMQGFAREKRLYKFIGKLKDYRNQMKQLTDFIKLFEVKSNAEEKQAARGILFPNFTQRVLLTCAKFFGMTFDEAAQKCKISDYLLILQDEGSAAQFEHNYRNIIQNKSKRK